MKVRRLGAFMPSLLQIVPVAAMLIVAEDAEGKTESIRSFEWHGQVEYGEAGEFQSCYLAKSTQQEPYPILYVEAKADRTFGIKLAFRKRDVPIEKRDVLLPGSNKLQSFPFDLGANKESRFLKDVSVDAGLYTASTSALRDIFPKPYTATLFLSDFSFGILSKVFAYNVSVTIALSDGDPLLTSLAIADGLKVSLPEPVGSEVSISFRHRSIWLPFAKPKSDASEALAAVKECVNRHLPPSHDQPASRKETSSTRQKDHARCLA